MITVQPIIKLPNYCRFKSVGCNIHKVNLEGNRLFNTQNEPEVVLTSVHYTMRDAKMKIKSRALLRNITDLTHLLNKKKSHQENILN